MATRYLKPLCQNLRLWDGHDSKGALETITHIIWCSETSQQTINYMKVIKFGLG